MKKSQILKILLVALYATVCLHKAAHAQGGLDLTSNVVLLHLDETNPAATFQDSAGFDDNATCSATCPLAGENGPLNNGVLFDGTDDFIDLDGGTGSNPTFDNVVSTRTIMLWFKANTLS